MAANNSKRACAFSPSICRKNELYGLAAEPELSIHLPMSEEQKTESRPERSGDNRDGQSGGFDRKKQRPRYRKKVLDTRNLKIDYKHPEVLERFISKTGKILPRRMTGATARVQRQIAREIKRARQISLLPYTRR